VSLSLWYSQSDSSASTLHMLSRLLSRTSMSRVVVVGSKNPVKIACVRDTFAKLFEGGDHLHLEVSGVNAASEVSDQPMGATETYTGALNRARNARSSYLAAPERKGTPLPEELYFVGIEGGVDEAYNCFASIIVIQEQEPDYVSHAKTATFPLPPAVITLMRDKGMELGGECKCSV
jgi:non-canonical (house-cleaning) NTP pyrophosphatase